LVIQFNLDGHYTANLLRKFSRERYFVTKKNIPLQSDVDKAINRDPIFVHDKLFSAFNAVDTYIERLFKWYFFV
jgi:hypothetical protein